jgi:hypothetical protein
MKRLRLLGGTLLVISIFWILGAIISTPKASAATTYNVTPSSECTLSDAMIAANEDISWGSCDAGSGADIINLAAGTYEPVGDLSALTTSITINGSGMNQTTIDGSGLTNGVFMISATSSDNIEINSLKIIGIPSGKKAIRSDSANIDISNVEIDGVGSAYASAAIDIINNTENTLDVNLSDIYIHNFNVLGDQNGVFSALTIAGGDEAGLGVVNAQVNNITIENIHCQTIVNVFMILVGPSTNFKAHTINAEINNVTIDDITSDASISTLGAASFTSSVNGEINADLSNITIRGMRGSSSLYGGSAALAGTGGGIGPGVIGAANFTISNLILTDNLFDGSGANCSFEDRTSLFGGAGTGPVTVTSNGGNISDDSSCSSYFTDPTDQNNVDPTDLHLGTLGVYGGSVPTIPLLEGSIAIDSGVPVAGLITDARGITRPQCSAYDSGAYEYNGTCPVIVSGSPDLKLSVALDPPGLINGQSGSYMFTFKNVGSAPMLPFIAMYIMMPTNVEVTDVDSIIGEIGGGCYDGGFCELIIADLERWDGGYPENSTMIEPGEKFSVTIPVSIHGLVDATTSMRALALDYIGIDTGDGEAESIEIYDYLSSLQGPEDADALFALPYNNIASYTGTIPGSSDSEDGDSSSDSDPIPDSVEDAAPGNGDGNNDGTPDSEQSNVTSLPITTGSNAGTYVTLVVPEGSTLTTTAIDQATTLTIKDTAYNYPLGLVTFTISTLTPGSTIPIELYYYVDQSPSSFTPRKYNTTNNTYTTLSTQTQTSLTQTTINNQQVLKLAYQLHDGGPLDQDGVANGTIIDPVGLAAATVGVPNTGLR